MRLILMNIWEKGKIYFPAFILFTIFYFATTLYLPLVPPLLVVPVWVILGGGLIFLSEYTGLVADNFG